MSHGIKAAGRAHKMSGERKLIFWRFSSRIAQGILPVAYRWEKGGGKFDFGGERLDRFSFVCRILPHICGEIPDPRPLSRFLLPDHGKEQELQNRGLFLAGLECGKP